MNNEQNKVEKRLEQFAIKFAKLLNQYPEVAVGNTIKGDLTAYARGGVSTKKVFLPAHSRETTK